MIWYDMIYKTEWGLSIPDANWYDYYWFRVGKNGESGYLGAYNNSS